MANARVNFKHTEEDLQRASVLAECYGEAHNEVASTVGVRAPGDLIKRLQTVFLWLRENGKNWWAIIPYVTQIITILTSGADLPTIIAALIKLFFTDTPPTQPVINFA